MKRGTPDHPKTRALAAALKVELAHAVGILEMLWHYTEDYAPRGDIGQWDDTAIADAVRWRKAPELLVQALVRTRFLEPHTEHRLIVHDWEDHCTQGVKRRLLARNQAFVVSQGLAPEITSQKLSNRYPTVPTPSVTEPPPSVTVTVTEPEAGVSSPPARSAPVGRSGQPLNDLERLQFETQVEFDAWIQESGLDRDVELARLSRTPDGSTIARIDLCPRERWLKVLRSKIQQETIKLRAQRNPGPAPPLSPKALQRERERQASMLGGLVGDGTVVIRGGDLDGRGVVDGMGRDLPALGTPSGSGDAGPQGAPRRLVPRTPPRPDE